MGVISGGRNNYLACTLGTVQLCNEGFLMQAALLSFSSSVDVNVVSGSVHQNQSAAIT